MSERVKELELSMEEVGLLVMLASMARPDAERTAPELLAVYYKARSVTTESASSVSLSANIMVRGRGR